MSRRFYKFMKKQNGLITWSGQPILFLMFYRPFWPEGALLHHAAHATHAGCGHGRGGVLFLLVGDYA